MRPLQRAFRFTALLSLAVGATACSAWRPAARYDGWTLYRSPEEAIAVEPFEAAFAPAFDAVEARLGSFDSNVRVHAWDGSVRLQEGQRTRVSSADDNGVHEVPGIGPARIQAYHARGNGIHPSGVFIGVPDPGTAVHELVHARFAELEQRLPLWFEEGLAGLLGDGTLHDGRWVVDGLACWPLRELREESLTDDELQRLLDLSASDEATVRENVLVHFVGWAIVFDMYRESGDVRWSEWLEEFATGETLAQARKRLEATLSIDTEIDWLVRLRDPDPGIRLATAKGTWKLRSGAVLDRLLSALETEEDSEVRVALAINALATAGELSLSWRRTQRVDRLVRLTLCNTTLRDEHEQQALDLLYEAYSAGDPDGRAQGALEELARFWEE